MKKAFLLVVFLGIGSAAFSQNVISLFGKANDFFSLLEENKYDTAHMYFAESEKSKLTVDNLKNLWGNLKGKLGKIEYLEAVRSQNQGDFYAVTLEGKFENDVQNFILLFNKEEKIVGIYTPPNAAVYNKPLYADTNLYVEKQVYVTSGKYQLAGIVTIPKNKKNFPMVVFVHGSGPNDMDETIGPNKPFRDIATGLATSGIGSLRYVKRTLVYPGDFTKLFTVKEEVIDDALAAITMAKTIAGADAKNIYLFGHSLGGMLAPRIASLSPDLKGIILGAAPARKLSDIIIEQNKYIVERTKDTTQVMQLKLKEAITEIEKGGLTKLGDIKPDSLILGLPAAYWVDLNVNDQVATAKKLKQRILIVQGEYDFQVSMTDYNLWNTALGKKANVKLKAYPTLNHLFSEQTEKGNNQQYQVLSNVSEAFIKDIATWIKTP